MYIRITILHSPGGRRGVPLGDAGLRNVVCHTRIQYGIVSRHNRQLLSCVCIYIYIYIFFYIYVVFERDVYIYIYI